MGHKSKAVVICSCGTPIRAYGYKRHLLIFPGHREVSRTTYGMRKESKVTS